MTSASLKTSVRRMFCLGLRHTGVCPVASRMRGEGFASNEVDQTIGFSPHAAVNVLDRDLDRKLSRAAHTFGRRIYRGQEEGS